MFLSPSSRALFSRFIFKNAKTKGKNSMIIVYRCVQFLLDRNFWSSILSSYFYQIWVSGSGSASGKNFHFFMPAWTCSSLSCSDCAQERTSQWPRALSEARWTRHLKQQLPKQAVFPLFIYLRPNVFFKTNFNQILKQ